MPHYDHSCNKCNEKFVIEMKMSEVDKKKITCPKCKSKDVTRHITNTSYWSESVNRYVWDK